MVRHLIPLLIKTFATFTAYWLAFRMTGEAELTTPVAATLIYIPLAYVLGDLGVFAGSGNTTALAFDTVLAAAVLWVAAVWVTRIPVGWPAVAVAAVCIGAVEFFQHIFLFREGVVELGRPEQSVDRDPAEKVRDDEETEWF